MDMTIFIIFVLTVFFTAKLQKKEHVLCYYKRYLPILEQMIANIRKNQHNYNNTIQTIAALPQVYTSYDELASTLTKFDKQIQNKIIPTKFLDFESKLLSALLYNKYCTACEKRVRLDFTNPKKIKCQNAISSSAFPSNPSSALPPDTAPARQTTPPPPSKCRKSAAPSI